jgi:hypothetical protein
MISLSEVPHVQLHQVELDHLCLGGTPRTLQHHLGRQIATGLPASRLWRGEAASPLCVPKTLSVLMWPRNHLSWRNDRAHVFRRGGLGLTIQVEDPA